MFARNAIRLLRRFKLPSPPPPTSPTFISSNTSLPSQFSTLRNNQSPIPIWALLYGQAAILMGMNANVAFAEEVPVESASANETAEAPLGFGLTKIEDGSIVSNKHTSKWWLYTNMAKKFHQEGDRKKAEIYLLKAMEEAIEGFGETDPHIASACNNLAELYRVSKEFDKADPLYLKAVKILEESYGPDDIRVAVAFDNLGQFYGVQEKLEKARASYERSLKIKRQVLGTGHVEYANTLYHVGRVMYLQGNVKDSEALVKDSIRILEEAGQEESVTCLRRLRYLSQMYLKSSRLSEAETILRKILHIFELSKGWESLDTATAAEDLGLTLQLSGNLKETQELLERCLDVRKNILKEDHIQIGATMLRIARVAMLNSNRIKKLDKSEASSHLDNAKILLDNSVRIARKILDRKPKRSILRNNSKSSKIVKDERAALFILQVSSIGAPSLDSIVKMSVLLPSSVILLEKLQSFIALGLLEITKHELQESREESSHLAEAEHAFRRCTTAFKEAAQPGKVISVCDAPEIKTEYLSCLNNLLAIMRKRRNDMPPEPVAAVQELEEEIKCTEAEVEEIKNKK